jgi:DNA-binding response OmpR family regulator
MGRQQTILVVDDETTVREVVRRYLELEGFRVIEADNGPLALHLLHQEKPDLIVLDIMLPGLDGFTITRSLREPARPTESGSVPIVMLTARSDEADRIMGFELGTDDYVVKPFSPRELIMRINARQRRRHADGQGIRPVMVPGAPSPAGLQPRPTARSGVGLRILRRREHRDRPYPPPARKT